VRRVFEDDSFSFFFYSSRTHEEDGKADIGSDESLSGEGFSDEDGESVHEDLERRAGARLISEEFGEGRKESAKILTTTMKKKKPNHEA